MNPFLTTLLNQKTVRDLYNVCCRVAKCSKKIWSLHFSFAQTVDILMMCVLVSHASISSFKHLKAPLTEREWCVSELTKMSFALRVLLTSCLKNPLENLFHFLLLFFLFCLRNFTVPQNIKVCFGPCKKIYDGAFNG